MRRSLPLAIALACGTLVSACSDTPTSTGPADPPAPELRTANNPGGPGALVIRFEDVFSLFFSDFDEEYSVVAGLSPAQLTSLCEGGEVTFEPMTGQQVVRPDGSIHQLLRARNVTVMVFEGAFADFCALPPLAVGRGSFIGNDNDLQVSLNRTNSFGFRLRGRVAEPGGERHRVLVKFHALITRRGVFREITSEIKLN